MERKSDEGYSEFVDLASDRIHRSLADLDKARSAFYLMEELMVRRGLSLAEIKMYHAFLSAWLQPRDRKTEQMFFSRAKILRHIGDMSKHVLEHRKLRLKENERRKKGELMFLTTNNNDLIRFFDDVEKSGLIRRADYAKERQKFPELFVQLDGKRKRRQTWSKLTYQPSTEVITIQSDDGLPMTIETAIAVHHAPGDEPIPMAFQEVQEVLSAFLFADFEGMTLSGRGLWPKQRHLFWLLRNLQLEPSSMLWLCPEEKISEHLKTRKWLRNGGASKSITSYKKWRTKLTELKMQNMTPAEAFIAVSKLTDKEFPPELRSKDRGIALILPPVEEGKPMVWSVPTSRTYVKKLVERQSHGKN